MKNFKPLSLAAAVTAASLGYTGAANAQMAIAAESGLGDMAIVPYYTVQGSFSTGISVINTGDRTEVVKIRLRRAADSMDALDFNVVLSPEDVWTGFIQSTDEVGELTGLPVIKFFTNDNSCTVPENNGSLTMPEIYRVGAEEGYIEVIGMGSPVDEQEPIAINALHAKSGPTIGFPRDCTRVSDNFRRGLSPTEYYPDWASFTSTSSRTRGVVNSALTAQWTDGTGSTTVSNAFEDTENVLKVSYFIKSDETGIEFGNDAVHIENFMEGATITNQTVGVFEGDLQGFDHPDLNGGAPTSLGITNGISASGSVASRDRYEPLRAILGGTRLINDWSDNDQGAFSVDTDWVVTTPGQYLMTNLFGYLTSLADPDFECQPGVPGVDNLTEDGENCDFRDIPMLAQPTVYDREERGIVVEEDELVVSPQPPGVFVPNVLDQEVNVITWGSPVLDAAKTIGIPSPDGASAGWATLGVSSNASKTQAICDFIEIGADEDDLVVDCVSTSTPAPLVGFVAWQRNFVDLPTANYGRIVEHSRLGSSSAP
jgi:hypothetical protein